MTFVPVSRAIKVLAGLKGHFSLERYLIVRANLGQVRMVVTKDNFLNKLLNMLECLIFIHLPTLVPASVVKLLHEMRKVITRLEADSVIVVFITRPYFLFRYR